jgi:hypothetical protein
LLALDDALNFARPAARGVACFAVLAAVLRIVFWAYTGRVWEDALITILHAENFASGLGLTHFKPGEPPLHGFTSPLSVLVPLMADIFHPGAGLHFIRVVSVLCGALTVLYAGAIGLHPSVRMAPAAVLLCAGYVAVEHHQMLWGMAGMETQMVVLVLLATFYYWIAWRPTHLGIALGFCMLARPDFAFLAIIVGICILVREPGMLPRVILVALAVYLPWVVFTTLYYGSPIPHTMAAKWAGRVLWWREPGLAWMDVKRNLVDRSLYWAFAFLGPSFGGHGTPPAFPFFDKGWGTVLGFTLAFAGGLRVLWKRAWPMMPAAAFVVVYAVYYVFFVPYLFGWYLVPFCAAAVLLAGYAIPDNWRIPSAALAAAWLLALMAALPSTISAERRIQHDVEAKVRIPLGRYLGEIMKPGEYAACEPLGYFAYYSRKPIHDWPGLASRRMTDFLRDNPDHRNMAAAFGHVRPEYLILRPGEAEYIRSHSDGEWFARDYRELRTFAVRNEDVRDILLIWQNKDCVFTVFQHTNDSGA